MLSARRRVSRHGELGDQWTYLLAGLAVERKMDAAPDAAAFLLLSRLPEPRVVARAHDREVVRATPLDRDRDLVGTQNPRQHGGSARTDTRHVACVRRI